MELHPLINKDIQHFDSGSKTAIEMMEDKYTVNEVIAFCELSIFKYGFRGGGDEDKQKVKTYTKYLTFLNGLANMGFGCMRVSNVYEFTNKEWRYR